MRGTRQSTISDYPFRLLRVRVYKESINKTKAIFDKAIFDKQV